MNAISNLCEAEQLDLLTHELQEIGLMPLLLNCDRHRDKENLMRLASAYQVDFAIIFSDILFAEDAGTIFESSKTILVTNSRDTKFDQAVILVDGSRAIKDAVNHLVETGKRNFLYLSGRGTSWIDKQRRDQFDIALKAHDLRIIAEAHGNYRYNSGYQEASLFLKRHPEVDAIVAGNDAMVIGVRDAAVKLFDRRIPEDLAILGHDGVEAAFWESNSLSTIALNHHEYVSAIIGIIKAFSEDSIEAMTPVIIHSRFTRGKTS